MTSPEIFTLRKFCAWAKIGRSMAYRLMRSGDLPVIKFEKKILVRREDAEALLERHLKRSAA
jgi:hypothetical protein